MLGGGEAAQRKMVREDKRSALYFGIIESLSIQSVNESIGKRFNKDYSVMLAAPS